MLTTFWTAPTSLPDRPGISDKNHFLSFGLATATATVTVTVTDKNKQPPVKFVKL
jgi:hypothetical protein